MRIKIIQELKPYHIDELVEMFKKDQTTVENILKNLQLRNVVRKLSKSIASDELEELMDLSLISQSNIELDGDMYLFKYVGMITVGDICFIIYPKYFKDYLSDRKDNYSKLKQIIEVISKYNSRSQNIGYGEDIENGLDFNLLAITLELIKEYFEYGIYRNDKSKIEQNGAGEVLWGKTINETTAYFVNNRPIYLDLYTIDREINEEDYFTRLHKAIITNACKKLKDILEILDKEVLELGYESLDDFGDKEHILAKINQELSTQFVTSKQNILKLMKKYIMEDNNKEVADNIVLVGTNSFNLVWEDVCRVAMNGKDMQDAMPKPVWKHRESGKKFTADKTLIPDIIVVDEVKQEIEIYDAKYYNIRLDENGVAKQPGVGDVTKQYLYELSLKQANQTKHMQVVKNAFLMPTDLGREINLGSASMSIFPDLHEIEVILKPAEVMYKAYIKSNK